MPGTTLDVRGGSLRWVYADAAQVILEDGTTVALDAALDDYAARVSGGRLVLRGNATLAVSAAASGAVAVKGGDLVLDGTSLAITGLAPGAKKFDLVGAARILAVPRWTGSSEAQPTVSVNGGAASAVYGATNDDEEQVDATCSGYSCIATCPAGKVVVTGQCTGGEGYALSLFGASVDRTQWSCGWHQANVADAGPAAAKATAVCAGAQ
jgi:hypothetical protein